MNKYVQKIRNYINETRKQYNLLKNKEYWNQLCSSLDTIEDCELAVTSYNDNKFSKEYGEKYLRLYGLFQALFVQQDAVKNLWESLQISEKFELGEKLKEIRKIRHESIGHPTKTFNSSYHFISRTTMEKSGFQLVSCYKNKTEFSDISVIDIINEQKKLLSEKLKTILQSLKDEEKAHKEKFKMKKLESAFPETFLYHIRAILESVLSADKRVLGKAHLEQIKTTLDNLKTMLKERGIKIDTYDSIKYLYELLEYPVKELEQYFNSLITKEKSTINHKTAYIFAYFIKEQLFELKEITKEIDDEYSS